MAREEMDDIQAMEAKETAHHLPWGWLVLFWGLILWGLYYVWTYSPGLGGWSQAKAFEEVAGVAGPASSEANIAATIFFTAAATAAAVYLAVRMSRRKTKKA
jgi:hypothetical protein